MLFLKNKIIIITNDIFIYTVKPVYNGHPLDQKKAAVWQRCLIKLRFRLAVDYSNWLLLTGGRCSQMVVNSGLTVIPKLKNRIILFFWCAFIDLFKQELWFSLWKNWKLSVFVWFLNWNYLVKMSWKMFWFSVLDSWNHLMMR